MTPERIDWPPIFDYGPATWTDLARIQECRQRIKASRKRLAQLGSGGDPIEMVQERLTLRNAEWELRRLQENFELKPDYF